MQVSEKETSEFFEKKSKQTETKTSLEEEESCQSDNKPGFVLCEQYQLSIC